MKQTWTEGLLRALTKRGGAGGTKRCQLLQHVTRLFNKCLFKFPVSPVTDAHVNSLNRMGLQEVYHDFGEEASLEGPTRNTGSNPFSCICQRGYSCASTSCGGQKL